MKRYIVILIIAIFFFPTSEVNALIEKDVVKIGWYNVPGLQFIDEYGRKTGQIFEYYQALSKYGDFEFEFIEESRNKCLEMLKEGKIDLLASVQYNDINRDYYEISDTTLGMNNAVILKKRIDKDIIKGDFETYDGKRIAVVRGSDIVEDLERFIENKKVSCVFIEYEDYSDIFEKKEENNYDLILTNGYNELIKENFEEIERFSASPIYIAMSSENRELVNEINEAMQQVEVNEPRLKYFLNDKYFKVNVTSELKINEREEKYLESKDKIVVAVIKNNGYMCYEDKKTKKDNDYKGIDIYFINEISEMLEKRFEIVLVNTKTDAINFLQKGLIDAIADFSYDYEWASRNGFNITNGYLKLQYYMAYEKQTIPSRINSIAIRENHMLGEEYFLKEYNELDLQYLKGYEECFEAVLKGKVDATICDNYYKNYCTDNYIYKSIEYRLIDYENEICFATKEYNKELASILSKCISRIDSETKTNIIKTSEQNIINSSNFLDIIYFYPVQSISIIFVIVVIIFGFIIVVYQNKITIKKNLLIEEAMSTAMHDSMTGLYNRLAIENLVSEKLKDNGEKVISALIMIDIDDFKTVNDNFGHDVGDMVICKVAKTIEECFDRDDAIRVRMGGDEFAVYFHTVNDINKIRKDIDKYMKRIKSFRHNKIKDRQITCSIGMAVAPYDGQDFVELYKSADIALYNAKEAGKNCFR